MTEPYTSYDAIAMSNAITMLAGSATFRTLLGATLGASAITAKARIIESWGGNPPQAGAARSAKATDGTSFALVPPFAHIHVPSIPSDRIAVATYEYRFDVRIVVLMPRLVGSETPAETFRRGRNVLGGIRADIEDQFGDTGCFAVGSVNTEGPELPHEASADGDSLVGSIIVSVEG